MGPRSRVKVAHVITRLDLGGAQQNTLYTCRNLDAERFDVLLIHGEGGLLDSDLASLPEGRPRLRRLSDLVHPLRPFQDLLAFLQLLNLFLSERPDVVHTHSSKAGILGRLAAWAAGVPVIIHTYHGFGFNDYQSAWTKGLYVLAERLSCRAASALVFVSKANWEYAARHRLGDEKRYRLLRSGIKLSDYPAKGVDVQKKKASLGLRMHKPLVLSIGNLKPQKNPGDFIAMAQAVNGRYPDAEFMFVGDGPLRRRLEFQILSSELHGKVLLPGWRRDTAELLACADVFVLTSLWEGLPRALVEAMRSGLPVVCYATDGVRDLVKDGVNGFMLEQGDVLGLARRVGELLGDEPLRQRIGKAAAASIGPEFDIDLMVDTQQRLYRELLEEHAG
ncbi:MAG: glycosyltransferase family 4 protein [Elusimicrobiota bacterium]|mgnify:CR=1 FL=1